MRSDSDFDSPPRGWTILTYVGGVVTAVVVIAGFEILSNYLHPTPPPSKTLSLNFGTSGSLTEAEQKHVAQLDVQSMKIPGTPIPKARVVIYPRPYVAPGSGMLTAAEQAMAALAWRYFQANWNEVTGLVNAADGFPSVTMWDQAAAMAALVSARELDLISAAAFETKMGRMLKTLATLPLYNGELPNKVYNARTLIPVNYGQLNQRNEIGWSAIDLGRMALWLKIVGARYPQLRSQADAVWRHWNVQRLTQAGQMFGTSAAQGQEQYYQEGRLGYENYAAYGLKLWGLKVDKALDFRANIAFVDLYGQGVPYDRRNYETSGANNYVLSEPFILDGIETGFQALPKSFADRVLAAQEARYHATQLLTAVTEDNLDQAPRFVYSTLFVNGQPWATITDTRALHNDLRFLSTKAAVGWHVLYNTDYTHQLFEFVQTKLQAENGWYGGYYESLQELNASLTANNNGVILECLLYKKVGQPLLVWAGVK